MAGLKILPCPVVVPMAATNDQIRAYYPEPCLFEIPGQTDDVVFVSTLLHGNEHTSFEILKFLTNEFAEKVPRKTLLVLVGNVEATAVSKRQLSGQQDYNRIWKPGLSEEHQWAQLVLEYIKSKKLFACIDIHNNSGKNPFYCCISELSPSFTYLASLFASTLVYFKNPDTVLSTNSSPFAPSVTLECGETGNALGVEKAKQFLLDVLAADTLCHRIKESDVHIFQTVGRIVVDPRARVAFGKDLGNLHFPEHIEELNFVEQSQGELFCRSDIKPFPLHILNLAGENILSEYCLIEDNQCFWRRPVVPSMFTRDTKVITQDCFGYIMQRIDLSLVADN
jgi:succinylglutamate desuccinylase